MKSAFLSAILLLAFAASAQAPATAPVALKNEPHHKLVLENDYARVWAFGIKGHDATLLHNHDLPYLGITLGAAEYVNAVTGKPEAHAKLADGQIGYSRGGFSHLVRTESDVPFRNITIELLKPQGAPRNRCVKVIADGALDCPQASTSPLDAAAPPALETDAFLLRSGVITGPLRIAGADAQPARLVCVLDQSELSVELTGQPPKTLHGGEAAWLPAGAEAVLAKSGAHDARFDLISFKHSAGEK